MRMPSSSSLLHTLFPSDKWYSWRPPQSRVEVYPLVEMSADNNMRKAFKISKAAQPHLNIASLLLALLIGEVAETLAGHPQQVDQLCVVRVGHEHLHQALHKPCAMLVVPLEEMYCSFNRVTFPNSLNCPELRHSKKSLPQASITRNC